MKKILVLCTGNSCRSQMAEGYLRHFSWESAIVWSAGIEAHGVNPAAVAVMKEDGVDISVQTSNDISEFSSIAFDYIITVCDNAKESCPNLPSRAEKFHYNFPDPAKATGTETEIMDQFRKVRDEIKAYCHQFAQQYII